MRKLFEKLVLSVAVLALFGCSTVGRNVRSSDLHKPVVVPQIRLTEEDLARLAVDLHLAEAKMWLKRARNLSGDNVKNITRMGEELEKAGHVNNPEKIDTSFRELRLLAFLGFIEEAKKWPQGSEQWKEAVETRDLLGKRR